MIHLQHLPNASGFEFIGHFKDGSSRACIVKKDPAGMHSVYTVDTDEPCWFKLEGWSRKQGAALSKSKEGSAE